MVLVAALVLFVDVFDALLEADETLKHRDRVLVVERDDDSDLLLFSRTARKVGVGDRRREGETLRKQTTQNVEKRQERRVIAPIKQDLAEVDSAIGLDKVQAFKDVDPFRTHKDDRFVSWVLFGEEDLERDKVPGRVELEFAPQAEQLTWHWRQLVDWTLITRF